MLSSMWESESDNVWTDLTTLVMLESSTKCHYNCTGYRTVYSISTGCYTISKIFITATYHVTKVYVVFVEMRKPLFNCTGMDRSVSPRFRTLSYWNLILFWMRRIRSRCVWWWGWYGSSWSGYASAHTQLIRQSESGKLDSFTVFFQSVVNNC
jgi:hypothetical protein